MEQAWGCRSEQGVQSPEASLGRAPAPRPTAPSQALPLPASSPTPPRKVTLTLIQKVMRWELRVTSEVAPSDTSPFTIQALPTRVPACTPIWSEPQPCAPWPKP